MSALETLRVEALYNRRPLPLSFTTFTLWWLCCCRSATAYSSDTKCLLSSHLASIFGGRSHIFHLERRLVASSLAPTSYG